MVTIRPLETSDKNRERDNICVLELVLTTNEVEWKAYKVTKQTTEEQAYKQQQRFLKICLLFCWQRKKQPTTTQHTRLKTHLKKHQTLSEVTKNNNNVRHERKMSPYPKNELICLEKWSLTWCWYITSHITHHTNTNC